MKAKNELGFFQKCKTGCQAVSASLVLTTLITLSVPINCYLGHRILYDENNSSNLEKDFNATEYKQMFYSNLISSASFSIILELFLAYYISEKMYSIESKDWVNKMLNAFNLFILYIFWGYSVGSFGGIAARGLYDLNITNSESSFSCALGSTITSVIPLLFVHCIFRLIASMNKVEEIEEIREDIFSEEEQQTLEFGPSNYGTIN